jgi:hypothetical protein
VDFHDGAVNKAVFEIGVCRQLIEVPLENALLGPSSEALPHRPPFAKMGRQVAPGRASPHKPQHRFEKKPVVPAGAARITLLARQKWGNPFPLFVAQQVSIQG